MRREPSKGRAAESISCSRKSWPWLLRSALAAGAVEAGASGHDAGTDRAPAAQAGLALPVVNRVVVLVGAEALEAVAVVRDRRPAARDRPGEHGSGDVHHRATLGARQAAGAPPRPHAGAEEDLVDVDVAQAGDL